VPSGGLFDLGLAINMLSAAQLCSNTAVTFYAIMNKLIILNGVCIRFFVNNRMIQEKEMQYDHIKDDEITHGYLLVMYIFH